MGAVKRGNAVPERDPIRQMWDDLRDVAAHAQVANAAATEEASDASGGRRRGFFRVIPRRARVPAVRQLPGGTHPSGVTEV